MIDMKAKDHGYLLKNFGDKGWGLYDLQTSSILMGSSKSTGSLQKTDQKDVSAFTDILSRAANDPSLRERPAAQPVAVKNNVDATSGGAAPKTDEAVMIRKEETEVKKKEEPAVVIRDEITFGEEGVKSVTVETYKRSVVTKKSETSTS